MEADVVEDIRNKKAIAWETAKARSVLAKHGRDTLLSDDLQRPTRKQPNPKETYYQRARSTTPVMLFSVDAPADTRRADLSYELHNGHYIYDLDRGEVDVEAVMKILAAWPYTRIAGRSVSGVGLWVVVRGPAVHTERAFKHFHREIGAALPEEVKCHLAESGQNEVFRLRYQAHDPKVYYNPDAPAVLDLPPPPEEPKPDDSSNSGISLAPPAKWPKNALAARRKAEKCLTRIDLPDDNSHDRWISVACCLIDGDRRWGEIFNGRDLFVSWTGDKARAGSTKHGSADAKYCELGRYAAQRPPGTTLTMASLPWLAGRERRTRDSIRTPSSVNTAPLTDSQERHLRLVQARGTPELVAIGRWYGREYLADEVVYDDRTESPCWWMYRDKRWRLLLNTSLDIIHDLQVRRYQVAGELERQGMRTLAAAMANDAVWGSLKGPPEFWAGLATELRGVPPEPADHYLGTPDCVVDLRDGSTLPHAPAFGIRSLTRGRYLGTDAADLVGVITERMGHGRVFSEETMWEYLRLIALAMTRKAQDHRALTLIIGKEGSGKEGAANLAREALGELAIGVSVDWFKPRHSDIDATTASILERRPVLVTVGEIGGDTHVGASRVLDKTGKAETNARRPHGPLLTGTIRAAVFTTSVEVPTFPAGTGIRRRLAVLPTLRKLKTAEKSSPTQAHYDAVITLAVNLCAKVYDASNYRPPEGHHAKKGKVIAEMDPVTDWCKRRS